MRKITFRGRRKDNNQWVYGYFYEKVQPLQCMKEDKDKLEERECYIIFSGFADWNMPVPMYQVEVIPETIGQCTDISDKHNKEIYDGDIVKRTSMAPGGIDFVGKVKFDYGMYWLVNEKENDCINLFTEIDEIEVIGNIFEKPELTY